MYKLRVYYEDTDCGGVVYHSNYLKFCERARSEVFFSNNIFFQEGWHFVVVKADCEFLAPAHLGDELIVGTKLIKSSFASAVLMQEITKGAKVIFRAKIKLAFIENNKPSKIPIAMKELLRSFFKIQA